MFDFHTHILPAVDDGSRSVEESLAMIGELKRQGVLGIAATPHFYAMQSPPESFFAGRKAAWERLKRRLPEASPEILLGAEVQYFEGIARYAELERFCLEGTRLLLVEMPMCVWTSRMVSAISEINGRESINVVIAHFERCLPFRNGDAVRSMAENGVLIQANAGFLAEKTRTAMKWLKAGMIHLLGTDCHNMQGRRPNMEDAVNAVRQLRGDGLLRGLEEREPELLGRQ